MECNHEEWIAQCKVADEAIQFKEKYSELERFNALHTNLLLTNLIKQGVLKKTGVDMKCIKSEKLIEALTYQVLSTNATEGKLKLRWEYLIVEPAFKNN